MKNNIFAKYMVLGVTTLFVLLSMLPSATSSPLETPSIQRLVDNDNTIRPCFIKITFYGKTIHFKLKGTIGYYYIFASSRDAGENGVVGDVYIKYFDGEIEEHTCGDHIRIHIIGFIGIDGLQSLIDRDGGLILGLAASIITDFE
jgi:hypothetical protein